MATKKKKFMQSLTRDLYLMLKDEANLRGRIEIQQLIRAVIIPEWLEHEKSIQKKKK